MTNRHVNYQRIKAHRNYTVEEIAERVSRHKNTVRQWLKCGLQMIDNKKPYLVTGWDLKDFLQRQRMKNKQPCGNGEIFCMKCRAPRQPALQMADFVPVSARTGNLIGLCPVCDRVMYRRVSNLKLSAVKGNLDVAIADGEEHIAVSSIPSVNSDF